MKKAPTLSITNPDNVEAIVTHQKDFSPIVGPSCILAITQQIPDLQRKYKESLIKKKNPEKFGSDEDENFIAVNVYDKPEETKSNRSIHSRMQQSVYSSKA